MEKKERTMQRTDQNEFLKILSRDRVSDALRVAAGISEIEAAVAIGQRTPAMDFWAWRKTASPAILTSNVNRTSASAAYIRALI